MMVNSPLEIYATVIGIKNYDSMFNILYAFGILYIPLMVLFFQELTPFFSMEDSDAHTVSRKRAVLNLAIFVFSLAVLVAPTRPLDVTSIGYRPQCTSNSVESHFGDTGTTFDEVFENLEYRDIKWPLGMQAALSIISGVTNAAIISLPCKTDVQSIKNKIDTTKLSPGIKQQVSRFTSECFASAKSSFDTHTPDKSQYQQIMKDYGGESDLSWIGSHVYQELYYSELYPNSPVPGFPYKDYPGPYQEHNKNTITPPAWGYPDCGEWWSDRDYGIKSKITQLVENRQPGNSHLGDVSIETKLSGWLQTVKNKLHIGSKIDAGDVIAHSILYDNAGDGGFGRFYNGWMATGLYSGVGSKNTTSIPGAQTRGVFSEIGAQAGQSMDAAFSSIKRAEIEQEVPIVQAVLLALLLSMGPIILVMGGFRLHVTFTYYFIIGSVLSITYIEKLIHYLEISLHESQSFGLYSLMSSLVMYNVFTKLYFIAPLLYLTILTICGVKLGQSVGGMMQSSISGGGSGSLLKGAGGLLRNIPKVPL